MVCKAKWGEYAPPPGEGTHQSASCLASQASEDLNTVGHTFTKGSKPI